MIKVRVDVTIAVQIIKLHAFVFFVIPAQAGIQWHAVENCKFHWTPACAGGRRVEMNS